MIKLTRLSDNQQFVIDGENSKWRATKIEGIDALTLNVYTETPAIGTGEIVTGKYTGRRDISVTAHMSYPRYNSGSGAGSITARSAVMDFFDPDDTYTMEIKYDSKDLFIDCELLAYKLPTGNNRRPLDLTFTMLCPDPYFYSGFREASMRGRFTVGGQFPVTPIISISLIDENEMFITPVSGCNIHIILPDNYQNSNNNLELDCKYGILTNTATKEDLTSYIVSGDPMPRIPPGAGYQFASFTSNKRPKLSGTLKITANNTASYTAPYTIKEVEITFPDGITILYTEPNKQYSHPINGQSYAIRYVNSSFVFNGPNGASINYSVIFNDSTPNRSSATMKFKELYRGF